MTFSDNDIKTFFTWLAHAPVLDFLVQMKTMGIDRHIPNISWSTSRFLIEKLEKKWPKNILEIWPANGFSTMMLSLACPDALITSVECSRHAFEELRHNISAFSLLQKGSHASLSPAELWPKVTSDIFQIQIDQFSLYYADARELLPAFLRGEKILHCSNPKSTLADIRAQKFDFIFIDGAFRMTREFFDLSLPLLTKNGLIILDDAIKYRTKMDWFHEYLEGQWIIYEIIQTDDDDGVMVIDFWNNLSTLS